LRARRRAGAQQHRDQRESDGIPSFHFRVLRF
jgi:hypothetical protein